MMSARVDIRVMSARVDIGFDPQLERRSGRKQRNASTLHTHILVSKHVFWRIQARGRYIEGIKARFMAASGPHGGVVVEEFLDAAALGEIYTASLLNVHPCSYDAYGMTVAGAVCNASYVNSFDLVAVA